MERTTKRQSIFGIELTLDNAEGYVDIFLDNIEAAHLIGTTEQRAEFSQTLSIFKDDISHKLSNLEANAMLRKLDETVAAKHYDEVRKVLDAGEVTTEFITAIRETPVTLSPVQHNIDKLQKTALVDQYKARTADRNSQSALRERAEQSAKVAASYAADTPVVKNGPTTLIGEQYTLQKLYETRRQLPKGDDARKDIDGVVRDAYGDNYALKDSSILATRVRQAVATVATAAVFTTLPNAAAYASELKTSEVIPNETKADKYINDTKTKVSLPSSEVEQVASSTKLDEPKPSLEVTPQVESEKVETFVIPARDQKSSVVPGSKTLEDNDGTKSDEIAVGDLEFKIPRAASKHINSSDKMKSDPAVPTPEDATAIDKVRSDVSETPTKTNTLELPTKTISHDDNSTPAASVKEGLSTDPIKAVSPGAQVEQLFDDPQLTFKLPKERRRTNDAEPNIVSVVVDNDLSFSLKKDKKNTGVKPIELPGGLEIIPIPVVPTPAPAPEAPINTPEQETTPATDFSQAAKKLAERGGVWERRGIAMQFFIDDDELKLTPSQAAGLVGNLLGESGADMEPGRSQLGGPAFGIAQWEGGRLMDLGAFGGKDQADFMTQLRFIKYELLGKERPALAAIKTATNRKDAAVIVREMYERPSAHRDDERKAYADEVGDAFNKEYQTILASRQPAKAEEKPNGILAGWPSTGESAMKLFNQCDPSWGEIKTPNGTRACDVSCGPTSVAMAVNALTGRDVNPGDVIRFTNTNKMWLPGDRGTSFDGVINLGKNFGINGHQMQNFKDLNAYKEVLQNGGMILVAGSGPVPFVTAPQAHFVLIRGMTTEGKFLVADPYPKTADTNTVAWDANQIINGTFGAVVFTK